jgi:hypothetical protein
VLLVLVGGVADAHGARVLIAGEVVDGLLLELAAPIDADDVRDAPLLLRELGKEVEEVVGLPVEAQAVRTPEGECRVAHERVAVVVVAIAAGDARQRRGGGGDDRAGGGVGEAAERQRAALELRAPGVVREVAAAEVLAPVGVRVVHQPERLVEAVRAAVLGPRDRDVGDVALAQRRACAGP